MDNGPVEAIRLVAGKRMGLGDVTNSVVPKFCLMARPRDGGTFAGRYFMPWKCHPTFAVTGSICADACVLAPGTVVDGLIEAPSGNPCHIRIEHSSGVIDVVFDHAFEDGVFMLQSASVLRTACKLFSGAVCIFGDPDDRLAVVVGVVLHEPVFHRVFPHRQSWA